MTPENYSSAISLSDLRLTVNLGVTAGERSNKQPVNISFKFFFPQPPKGFVTDEVQDTICYFEISEIIKQYCDNKHFKLLEFMTHDLYKQIRPKIPATVKIWLKIEKFPPIEFLHGGTSFEYSDLW